VTSAALATLGFHPRWLESGLLDAAGLQRLLERFGQSDDRNTEHYRYAAVLDVIRRYAPLDDTRIEQYLELARLDPTRGWPSRHWWNCCTAAG
jgi:hypothetical protein